MKTDRLTDAEEQALVVRWQAGDTAARERLARWLVSCLRGIAVSIKPRGADLDDLVGVGGVAIATAMTRYHDDGQHKLARYAVRCVVRAMVAAACRDLGDVLDASDVPDGAALPDEQAAQAERITRVTLAMREAIDADECHVLLAYAEDPTNWHARARRSMCASVGSDRLVQLLTSARLKMRAALGEP